MRKSKIENLDGSGVAVESSHLLVKIGNSADLLAEFCLETGCSVKDAWPLFNAYSELRLKDAIRNERKNSAVIAPYKTKIKTLESENLKLTDALKESEAACKKLNDGHLSILNENVRLKSTIAGLERTLKGGKDARWNALNEKVSNIADCLYSVVDSGEEFSPENVFKSLGLNFVPDRNA